MSADGCTGALACAAVLSWEKRTQAKVSPGQPSQVAVAGPDHDRHGSKAPQQALQRPSAHRLPAQGGMEACLIGESLHARQASVPKRIGVQCTSLCVCVCVCAQGSAGTHRLSAVSGELLPGLPNRALLGQGPLHSRVLYPELEAGAGGGVLDLRKR